MAPKKAANTKKRTMSDDHKTAIAEGRKQAKAVKDYLEALAANKPKRGRQRTADSIAARMEKIDELLVTADELTKLNLRQEKIDLAAELAAKSVTVDLSALEDAFVAHAAAYGVRKGISYGVWRESGVPAAVLTRAGIRRGA